MKRNNVIHEQEIEDNENEYLDLSDFRVPSSNNSLNANENICEEPKSKVDESYNYSDDSVIREAENYCVRMHQINQSKHLHFEYMLR